MFAGPFTQLVWRTLKDFPLGDVITYGDLAKRCGRSNGAARAVGTAMRTNPVPLIVPCHRVVKKGGDLGRYSGGGGSRTKQWLLDHEAVQKLKAVLSRVLSLPDDVIWAELADGGFAFGFAEYARFEANVVAYQAAWADARAAIEATCTALLASVAAHAYNQAEWADTHAAIEAAYEANEANIAEFTAIKAAYGVFRAEFLGLHIQQHQMADGA